MADLKAYCCYQNSRIAAIIAEWIEMILSLMSIIALSFFYDAIEKIFRHVEECHYFNGNILCTYAYYLNPLLGVLLLSGVVVIASVILIVGTMRKNQLLMLPYVIFEGLMIVFLGFWQIYSLLLGPWFLAAVFVFGKF